MALVVSAEGVIGVPFDVDQTYGGVPPDAMNASDALGAPHVRAHAPSQERPSTPPVESDTEIFMLPVAPATPLTTRP